MDKIAEAIKRQYQRQQTLIDEQNRPLEIVDKMGLELKNGFLLSALRGEVIRYYKRDFEAITVVVQNLEAVR